MKVGVIHPIFNTQGATHQHVHAAFRRIAEEAEKLEAENAELKAQLPRTVKVLYFNNDMGSHWEECPSCGRTIPSGLDPFCACGVKLDRSEDVK
jgi:hypothetical protein